MRLQPQITECRELSKKPKIMHCTPSTNLPRFVNHSSTAHKMHSLNIRREVGGGANLRQHLWPCMGLPIIWFTALQIYRSLHFITTGIIGWFLQTLTICQKLWKVTWIDSGIRTLSCAEDLPTSHAKSPLYIYVYIK